MTDSPLRHLTLARLRLFFREPGAVFWTFGFPLLISVALGIAFRSRPPEPVTIAVVDTGEGREIHRVLAGRSDIHASLLAAPEAERALRVGKVALVVRPGPPPIFRYDPSRPESRLARLVVDEALQRAAGRLDTIAVTDTHVTEPGARYIDFLIPGLLGFNIMSSGLWGLGYVIVETRTKKLLKRMLATPMRRSHFLLSFVLMRLFFLALEVPVLLGFAYFAFDVAVRGSLVLLAVIALLGALAFSGIGVLVASRAQNTATVSGLINLAVMPMLVLSGVFFSTTNFPAVMQPVIRALPLTALNDALRAIMNEGAGVAAVSIEAAMMTAVALISFGLGLKIFRWN